MTDPITRCFGFSNPQGQGHDLPLLLRRLAELLDGKYVSWDVKDLSFIREIEEGSSLGWTVLVFIQQEPKP